MQATMPPRCSPQGRVFGVQTRQSPGSQRLGAAGRLYASTNPARQNKGFFSEIDPAVEVAPVRSSLAGSADVTKRGGRWDPEFVWQTNWAETLDQQEAARKRAEEEIKEEKRAEGKGYLSLGSKLDLNDMSLDLSEQLRVRKKSGADAASSKGGGAAAAAGKAAVRRSGPRYSSVPVTRVEQRAWERGSGYAKRVIPVAPTNEADEAAQAEKLAAERARYEQLKAELQAWAAGLTAVCLSATFAFYGREVAASYGVGALGGLVYLRLLNRSVDAVGGGGLGGALGQPRLLIPVILTLGYNRYNQMMADDTGLTLQLLPMLLGFFTYKGAVIARQSLELFNDLTSSYRGQPGNAAAGAAAAQQACEDSGSTADVASVDRAFRSKVLKG